MKAHDIRITFLKFFEQRGHAIVPSSSLLPDDPSVLLTTAGMQQFKPYYTGSADPLASPHTSLDGRPIGALSAASVQKSFRTSDIDEVGDKTHLTFFEMLGNFSFGGYFKEEAIRFAYDFFKEVDLPIHYVTVFAGDKEIPRDEESVRIWKELGVTDIREYGREDNFWGPTGTEGPCGPSTEIYVNDVEVWNVVFNEFYKEKDGTYRKLEKPGVDTGMGLERLAVALQGVDNVFETDLFTPILAVLPNDLDEKSKRVIVDHARGAAFLLSDGVRPSNKEAGYVLRRLIRRAIVLLYLRESANQANPGIIRDKAKEMFGKIFDVIVAEYGTFYPGLNREVVGTEFNAETDKFMATLVRGIKEVERTDVLDAPAAFKLYESFGLPYEVIREVAPEKTKELSREAFDAEMEAHRAKSREGSEAKFGGHGLLLDTGELKARDEAEVVLVTRLHTATHLLQAGLRKVLGESVHQDGSDITAERLRFDFTFDRKVTDEELKEVQAWVNEQIQKNLTVSFAELPYEEAVKSGALYFTKEKYPAVVKVYTMGGEEGDVVSKEFCGGPHVGKTGEVGVFKIIKEESVSAGVRRIRAVVS